MNFVNLIQILKKNTLLLYLAAFIYSTFNCWYKISYWVILFSKKHQIKGSFLKNVTFNTNGGVVEIGPRTQMYNCKIKMDGKGNKLAIIGGGTCIKNTTFNFIGNDCKCKIETNFTMEGGSINLLEGRSIDIGQDCMFSSDIYISVSDFHTIIKLEDGKRINIGKDIKIGNHVWVGKDSKILKGVTIADNSIIGTSSVVTRSLTLSHSVYGGLPAQLLKTDVDWNREH